jgi:hypothetical protein
LVLSIGAADLAQPPSSNSPVAPALRSDWLEVEKPIPAFVLTIPEAASQPSSYAIHRHVEGGGRKDILGLGEPDAVTPYLQVEIYRPGDEVVNFAGPAAEIAEGAAALGPVAITPLDSAVASKFGPLTLVSFETSIGAARQCLGFLRAYIEPRLRMSGWFCQGGELVPQSTLTCALDRLTLLAAGSEPRIGALFAQAELNRSFCGQREPLLAATPKYRVLWEAMVTRPEPRRVGR